MDKGNGKMKSVFNRNKKKVKQKETKGREVSVTVIYYHTEFS